MVQLWHQEITQCYMYVLILIYSFIDFILLKVKDIDIPKAEELIIFKFDDRESKEPVMFG
jgi:hypothetical protein